MSDLPQKLRKIAKPLFDVGPEGIVQNMLVAADRIEKLENALKIIASSGEGQFRWSITKIETLAIKVLSND